MLDLAKSSMRYLSIYFGSRQKSKVSSRFFTNKFTRKGQMKVLNFNQSAIYIRISSLGTHINVKLMISGVNKPTAKQINLKNGKFVSTG